MSEVGHRVPDRAFYLPVVVEALFVAAPLDANEPRTRLVVEMFGECQLEVQRGAHDLRIGILVKPSKKRLPTSRRDGVRDLIANSFGAGLDEGRLREFGELAIHMAAIQVPVVAQLRLGCLRDLPAGHRLAMQEAQQCRCGRVHLRHLTLHSHR